MKNNKSKFLAFCVGLISIVVPLFTTLSTFAIKVDDIKDSPSRLAEVQDYKDAVEACLKGSLPTFTYTNNMGTQTECKGVSSACKASGFKEHNFFSSVDTEIHNSMLEKQHGTGSWFFGTFNDNGNLQCKEGDSALFNSAMKTFEATDDQIKNLVCNQDTPGIYNITATGGDGDITSCSQSYDLLMQYINNGEQNPSYTIKVTPNNNANAYFNTWFGQNFGSFGLNDQQKKAATYAKASKAFMEFCVDGSPSEQPFNSSDEIQVYDSFTSGGDPKQVYYKFKSGARNKNVYIGVSTDGSNAYTCQKIAEDLLTEDNAKAYAAELAISNEQPVSDYSGPTSDEVNSEDEEEANCYNSGGPQSIGWIMCPIIDLMTNASKTLYNEFVEPALQVPPSLFAGGNSATHQAWSIFRDIANVCFIILVLVVIFSQVTGVGIDNYGIKKILPKLIVVAILVNLSYILCQVCIDLSNILGNALQNMFNSFQLAAANPADINSNPVGTTALNIFVPVALVGIIAAGGLAIWDNPAIVLSIFIGFLGVIIAIIFLFLLLYARQAAIIVLTVLSPLAVICYALPNTKSISDKWVKFFEGLLMVYPICGVLVGGGSFVSSLLLSSGMGGDGFMPAFTAMIIGVIPIFFIPTVLKSSFSAMGNIGAKISGMGDRARGFATQRMRGSEAYRNAQASSIQRRTRHKAGLKKDGESLNMRGRRKQDLLNLKNSDNRLVAGAAKAADSVTGTSSGLNRYRRQYLKDNEANNESNSLANMDNYERAVAQQKQGFENAAVEAVEAQMAMGGIPGVDINDRDSIIDFHSQQLAAADRAQRQIDQANSVINSTSATGSEKRQAVATRNQASADLNTALNNVKAAQNNLVKSEGGRDAIVGNYQTAIANGRTGGLQSAAAQMMSEHGGELKRSSEGDNEMVRNMATAHSSSDFSSVAQKIADQSYEKMGTDKYDAESLVAADSRARKSLYNSMASMDENERAAIQEIARQAQSKIDDGSLNASAPTQDELRNIINWSSTGSSNNPAPTHSGPTTTSGGILIGSQNDVQAEIDRQRRQPPHH